MVLRVDYNNSFGFVDLDAPRWEGLKDYDDYSRSDLGFRNSNATHQRQTECLFENICNEKSAGMNPCIGLNSIFKNN